MIFVLLVTFVGVSEKKVNFNFFCIFPCLTLTILHKHIQVSAHLLGSTLQESWQSKFFVTCMFIEICCDSEKLPLLVYTPKSQFNSSTTRGKVRSLCHFGPTCRVEEECVQNCCL